MLSKDITMINSACYETTSGTTLTGTINASKGEYLLATVTTRSTTTYPDGWTLLHESTILTNAVNQRMAFLCKKIESDGTESVKITQSSSARIYLNLISFTNCGGFKYHEGSESYSNATASVLKTGLSVSRPSYNYIVWGCTANIWNSASPYTNWTCDSLTAICLDQSKTAPRQANFIDTDTNDSTRIFTTPHESCYIIDFVEVLPAVNKYLLRQNGILHTFENDELIILEDVELNGDLFIDRGFEDASLIDLYIMQTLDNVEILAYNEYWTPSLQGTLAATPNPQVITSENIIFDSSIASIENIEVNADESTLFSFSIDDGNTWKSFDSTANAWIDVESGGMNKTEIEALTLTQISELLGDARQLKIKFTLSTVDNYVNSININFTNS